VACEGAGLTWVRRQVLTAVGSHGVLWVVGGLLRCIGGCRRVPTVRAVVAGVGGAWGYGQALTACGNRRRARAVRVGRPSSKSRVDSESAKTNLRQCLSGSTPYRTPGPRTNK
jgi:hypothetical protein